MKKIALIALLVVVGVNPSLVKLALNTSVDITHTVLVKSFNMVSNVSVAGVK